MKDAVVWLLLLAAAAAAILWLTAYATAPLIGFSQCPRQTVFVQDTACQVREQIINGDGYVPMAEEANGSSVRKVVRPRHLGDEYVDADCVVRERCMNSAGRLP